MRTERPPLRAFTFSPSTKIIRPNHNIIVSKHCLILFKYLDIFKTYDKVFNFFYATSHRRYARCFFAINIRIKKKDLMTLWNVMFNENLFNVS